MEQKKGNQVYGPVNPNGDYGTENLEKFIDAISDFVDAFRKATNDDGKVGLWELRHFFGPITALPGLITAAPHLPKEWSDLSAAEADRLRGRYGSLLDDPFVTGVIDGALRMTSGLFNIFNKNEDDEGNG